MLGTKNHFYGKNHTNETKLKLSKQNSGSFNVNGLRIKLTWKKVSDIRLKYASGIYTHEQLAKEYGVKKNTITKVLNNKTWKSKI